MDPALLNTGNPGWGPAHELGHDFIGPYTYCWEEADSNEGWANFMAFYAFERGVFINSDYDAPFWGNVWRRRPSPPISSRARSSGRPRPARLGGGQGLLPQVRGGGPGRGKTTAVKKKQAVRYLAEEAPREVAGSQSAYDDVVAYLVARGFPTP